MCKYLQVFIHLISCKHSVVLYHKWKEKSHSNIKFNGLLEIMSSSIYAYQYPHIFTDICTLKKRKNIFKSPFFFASFQRLPGQCQPAEQAFLWRFVSPWFAGRTAEVRTSVFDDFFRVRAAQESSALLLPLNSAGSVSCCSNETFPPDLVILLCTHWTFFFFFLVFIFKLISKLKGSGRIYQSSPGLLTCYSTQGLNSQAGSPLCRFNWLWRPEK